MAERKRKVGRPRKHHTTRKSTARRSGHGKRGRKKGYKMSAAQKKAISAGMKRYWASKGKGRKVRRKASKTTTKHRTVRRRRRA